MPAVEAGTKTRDVEFADQRDGSLKKSGSVTR